MVGGCRLLCWGLAWGKNLLESWWGRYRCSTSLGPWSGAADCSAGGLPGERIYWSPGGAVTDARPPSGHGRGLQIALLGACLGKEFTGVLVGPLPMLDLPRAMVGGCRLLCWGLAWGKNLLESWWGRYRCSTSLGPWSGAADCSAGGLPGERIYWSPGGAVTDARPPSGHGRGLQIALLGACLGKEFTG